MEKQNVFVVNINRGVWEVFDSKEKVIDLFRKELVGDFDFEDEGKMSLEEGVEHLLLMGSCGEVAICQNEELCEMGDDYCELSVVKSDVK
jgi:hypothetical protein